MGTEYRFLDDLDSHVNNAGLRTPSISQWSIGWHIQHSCMVAIGIVRVLTESKPPAPKVRGSRWTPLVLWTGWIPRGRGRAPDVVSPTGDLSASKLHDLIDQAREQLNNTSSLNGDVWFRHFYFGILNRDKSIRFIQIHTNHHLKIIADIERARN